jgi:hypothetical protein
MDVQFDPHENSRPPYGLRPFGPTKLNIVAEQGATIVDFAQFGAAEPAAANGGANRRSIHLIKMSGPCRD